MNLSKLKHTDNRDAADMMIRSYYDMVRKNFKKKNLRIPNNDYLLKELQQYEFTPFEPRKKPC